MISEALLPIFIAIRKFVVANDHLRLKVKPGDFFYVMKAVERLNERAAPMETTVSVVASAKTDQPFVANTLHNLVVEPMVEESDVVVLEEQVEE